MDKETKNLIDFYHDRIKYLEDKNKEKQDKLDKIKRLIIATTYHTNEDILKIIKGEDK